jgi:hypothetical protein
MARRRYRHRNPLSKYSDTQLAVGGLIAVAVIGGIGYLIHYYTTAAAPALPAAGTTTQLSPADAANAASIGLTPQEYAESGLVGSAT